MCVNEDIQLKKSRKNWYFNKILCKIDYLTSGVLRNRVFWLKARLTILGGKNFKYSVFLYLNFN